MIDFLVIGGGVAGLSVAARLSVLGSVVVLEREAHLAYHASGRSAAMFEENYGNAAVIALNKASYDYHMTANGGVLSPRGLMMPGTSANADVFARDVAKMQMSLISIEQALERVPILDVSRIDRVAVHSGAMDIDTDLLIQNFAKDVRRQGGVIVTGAAVTRITRICDGWDVFADEAYTARHIVNAAGPWADEVAVMAGLPSLGLQAYRRSVARIPAPGGYDVSKWPMLFGPGETWYAKPDAGALIVSPADEDPVPPHDAWADDIILAEGLDRYAQHMTTPVDRLLTSWAGLRTFAPDRTLVLGPASQEPSFIWCAGQGGYGFQTAPAASQLIADILSGNAVSIDAAAAKALSPQRFDS